MTASSGKADYNRYMRSFSVFLLAALLFLPLFYLSAQIPQGESLEIIVNPEFPEPGSVATLSLSTFSFDSDGADIVWRVGGVVVLQGVGQKNLRVFLGEAGEETRVSVSVTSGLGASFERSITIRPASVDIIAEPLTYTPPFYKGAARLTSEALVRLTAAPLLVDGGGRAVPSRDLIYTWYEEDEPIAEISGAGKQSVIVSAPVEGVSAAIGVRVQSRDRRLAAQKYIDLVPERPRVILYEDHPTLGIRYNRAFTVGARVTDPETTFVVEPYFFSVASRSSPNLTYNWSADGQDIFFEGGDRGILTLRQEGESEGRVDIGLTLQNVAQVLQAVEQSFLVFYGR